MILLPSPISMVATLVLHRAGDVLTLDGLALDFGLMPPGAVLPGDATDSPWIAGDVIRDPDGTLRVRVLRPYWGEDNAAAAGTPVALADGDTVTWGVA